MTKKDRFQKGGNSFYSRCRQSFAKSGGARVRGLKSLDLKLKKGRHRIAGLLFFCRPGIKATACR
jgi:hypothetical protein